MLKRISKFFTKRPDLALYLGLLLLGLHVFIGLKGGLFYIGGDTGIPLNPYRDFNLLYLWQNQEGGVVGLNLGIIFQLVFFAFFKWLGLDLWRIQHLYIYLAHTLAAWGMCYLVNSFSLKRRRLIALVASVVYMFSPWLFNYLGIFVFLPYSVMPFILAVFVRGVKGKMAWLKAALLINFFLLGVIVNFPQYSMYFVAVLLMVLYGVFYLLVYRRRFWSAVGFGLVFSLVTFFGSLWFILPYWRVFSSTGIGGELVDTVLISSAIHNFGDYGFSTILHLLRMFGAAGFMNGGATYSGPYLDNSFLILTSFLLPLFAFLALFFRLKSRAVLFFGLVALIFIFIAKGVNSPFGNLHFWLVNKFPLARAFRTTWNLSLGANIAYAFLVGIGVVEVASRLSLGSRKPRRIFLVILGLTGLILIGSWPLWSGAYFQLKSNPPSFEGVKIPPAYYELEDYLVKDRSDSRLFRIPNSEGMIRTNWGYSGSDFSPMLFSAAIVSGHPLAKASAGLLEGVYKKIESGGQLDSGTFKLLALLNAKKIVFDGYDDTTKFKVEKVIPSQFGVTPQVKIGRFEVYQLGEESFLPHFYLADRLIYTNVIARNFSEVVDFPEYQLKSSILPLELKDRINLENLDKEIVLVNDPLVSLEIEDQKQRILDRLESEVKGVFFPYARWRPGGLIYSLVLEKERLSLKSSRQQPKEAIEKDLLFAGKRIVELTRWGTALNDGQWQQISDLYHQSMEDIFPRLEELYLAGDKDTFIGLLSRVQVSLLAHRGKLEEALFLKGGYLERGESMMKSFNNLEKRLEEINRLPDFLGLTYTFNIPQSGNYELTFQENKRSFAEMTAVLDGLNVDGQEIPLGGLRFYQQGQHQIALSFKEGENLLSVDRWSHGLDPFLEEAKGLVSFRFFPLPPGEASSVVHQEILGYVPEAYYQLSFDYLAKDKQAGVAVIQDTDVNKENSEVNPLVLRQLPGTAVGEFGHFRTVFRSAAGSSWANIYLLARQEQGELDSVKFKNVYLERVFGPKVVLRRQVLASLGVRNESPKIIFTRVNTTKYRVNVKGATAPYLLVFSESFHPGWKIYSKKEIEREKVTTSYFSGLINEGEHRNTFWAASTFETWKKRPIDEERHYQVNGYANAWQILPEDVEGRDDYELVVEFEPQKYFYIGIIVSLSVFGFCLTYLLVKRIWK